MFDRGRLHADHRAFQNAAKAARESRPDAPAGASGDVAELYSGGRITEIPARRPTRVRLLRDLAERHFEFDRVYTEKEVTEALAADHDDPVQLRRYLIDELFLERTRDGGEYRRREAPPI